MKKVFSLVCIIFICSSSLAFAQGNIYIGPKSFFQTIREQHTKTQEANRKYQDQIKEGFRKSEREEKIKKILERIYPPLKEKNESFIYEREKALADLAVIDPELALTISVLLEKNTN